MSLRTINLQISLFISQTYEMNSIYAVRLIQLLLVFFSLAGLALARSTKTACIALRARPQWALRL